MNTPRNNQCPSNAHEWEPSAWEPGLECCAWPNCGAVREAPVTVVRGVDVPTDDLVAAVRSARAA